MTQPVLVGVAGGSGSGKTTLARSLAQSFRPDQVQIVYLDAYYKNLSAIPPSDRDRINYDHPDAFDQVDGVDRGLAERVAGAARDGDDCWHGRHAT